MAKNFLKKATLILQSQLRCALGYSSNTFKYQNHLQRKAVLEQSFTYLGRISEFLQMEEYLDVFWLYLLDVTQKSIQTNKVPSRFSGKTCKKVVLSLSNKAFKKQEKVGLLHSFLNVNLEYCRFMKRKERCKFCLIGKNYH